MNENERIIKKLILDPHPLAIQCQVMGGEAGYHWGGKKYIPALLGFKNNENKPFAELWIGAHDKSPANIIFNKSKIKLNEFIRSSGNKTLGNVVDKKFRTKLPYLMKVLSAGKPLSIQAHPDKKQAEEGWKKEKGKGPNYKDDNHKPELICALTKFWALNGFRKLDDILKNFGKLKIIELRQILDEFKINHNFSKTTNEKKKALKVFYTALMTMPKDKMEIVVNKIIKKARLKKTIFVILFPLYPFLKKTREYWILKSKAASIAAIDADIKNNNISSNTRSEKIKESLSGIPGIYLLNLVALKPGEAMFLPAGELHAYLEGSGIEIMANSDNVLRAGLTHKHMDVNELLHILTFNYGEIKKISPEHKSSAELIYKTAAKEFELSKIILKNNKDFVSSPIHSADSLIILNGLVEVTDLKNNSLFFKKGETAFIPANVGQYKIKSISKSATVFKASVPI